MTLATQHHGQLFRAPGGADRNPQVVQDTRISCEHPQRLLRGGQRDYFSSEEVSEGVAGVSVLEMRGGDTRCVAYTSNLMRSLNMSWIWNS